MNGENLFCYCSGSTAWPILRYPLLGTIIPTALHKVSMALDAKDVKKIAFLARLDISETEVATSTASLSRILGLIEEMNAVDTKAIAPMAHPQDAALRLRDDRVTEPDQRYKFQAIAPATEAGLYLVPKVIE